MPDGGSNASKPKRPESFVEAKDRLSPVERFSIRTVRRSFDTGWVNGLMGWLQRTVGQGWVYYCTRKLLYVRGLERVPRNAPGTVIFISNHRSFFDMFVGIMIMFHSGIYKERLVFPVRSKFFYDNPAGLIVNFLMSFLSMYPPIFRDRKRLLLNHVAISELSKDLNGRIGGIGIHPEGRRNLKNPYTLLPYQTGIGRLIHITKPTVIPFFINGLGNDLKKQIAGNFTGNGDPITVVYGKPIDFDDLIEQDASVQVHKALAAKCMHAINELAQEERPWRNQVLAGEAESNTFVNQLQKV